MVAEQHYAWRYLAPAGRRVHALRIDQWTGTGHLATAQCGIGVWRSELWHGTGSQIEYERAATLPKCQRCLERIHW